MKDFLTAQEAIMLKRAHHLSREKRAADRIKTVLFLNEGFSFGEAARLLMLDDSTIREYLNEYRSGGLDKLLEDNFKGGQSKLSSLQEKELKLHLSQVTYPTVKEIKVYIKQEFQVDYSIVGLTHLPHRLGFVYKKTRVMPGKLNPQLQFEFVKEYGKLKQTKREEDRIYFLDSTHPIHNNMPSQGWILRGENKFIKTNTGRARLNITGALNIEDLTVKMTEYQTINAQATVNFLKSLEDNQTEGLLYCIVDNARYYRNRQVKAFLIEHPRIQLIFLPPYSPNLNIIERLWLLFHQKVLYGRYYSTFKEFREATLNFFANIKEHRQELNSRLTDNFQVKRTFSEKLT